MKTKAKSSNDLSISTDVVLCGKQYSVVSATVLTLSSVS